jgi:putative endonuclease
VPTLPDPRHQFGRDGERLAERLLRKSGLKTVARHFNTPVGELDLVMRDGDALVFVEVKTRRDRKYADPEDAVTREKRRRMVRTARWYIEHTGWGDRPCRFDVVTAIVPVEGPPQLEHFADAFEGEGV